MGERRKKFLLDLTKKPGNDKCGDCGAPEPDWASYNLGIFLCESCAGLHRHLGSHISKIKSIKLDNWDDDIISFMEASGNVVGKSQYENDVPPCYRVPTPDAPQVLREQWIRAKYERLEFTDSDKQTYLLGHIEGYLWKRGKDDKKFNRRKFVLDEAENVLKYYNKEEAKEPKAALRVDDLNVALVPAKVGNPNGMQIVFEQDGSTRSIYVFADDGKNLVHWYTAIRCARLNRLRIAYPGVPDTELIPLLTRDFIKEGWLCKKGPNKTDAYRKRWITLDKRKILYSEFPTDAFPKGEIFVGTEEHGFKVKDGVPPEVKGSGFSFTLRTPKRQYHWGAENEQDKNEWMQLLRAIIATPLSPQDTSAARRMSPYKRSTFCRR